MAWYQGITSTYEFPGLLASLMQNTKKLDGSPAWELISKNIGEPESRNVYSGEGYVLHSTGSDGKSDITIRILPILQYTENDAYWCMGAEMGVVGKYTPGEGGANGTCTDVIPCKLCYELSAVPVGGYSARQATKLPLLRYYISITEDRVIIIGKSNRVRYSENRRCTFIAYLGEIDSALDYRIKTTVSTYKPTFLGSNTTSSAGVSYFQGLSNNQTPVAGTVAYTMANSNQGDTFNSNCVDVYPVSYKINNQYIGELKDVLFRRLHNSSLSCNTLPEEGTVVVDGEEYLCVRHCYLTHGYYSPFMYTTEDTDYYILVRKV